MNLDGLFFFFLRTVAVSVFHLNIPFVFLSEHLMDFLKCCHVIIFLELWLEQSC